LTIRIFLLSFQYTTIVRKTVNYLIDQSSNDYKIIIVDNNSTDGTDELARKLAENDLIRYTEETSIQSSYAARNTGVKASEGDVLGFLDADTWVEPDYVEKVIEKWLKMIGIIWEAVFR